MLDAIETTVGVVEMALQGCSAGPPCSFLYPGRVGTEANLIFACVVGDEGLEPPTPSV